METSGFRSFRYRLTPMMVPVVPMLLTKCVMRPCVCRHSSGPVTMHAIPGGNSFRTKCRAAIQPRLILTSASCTS